MASEALAVITKEIEARGIPAPTWNTMMQTLYPGSSPASVLLVWDYCQARQLDPLKKPVHIVPMRVKQGDQWVERDTVLPGIYEYRTTAHRTGEYLGHDKPKYGPEVEEFGVKAPEWCEYTVYRWNEKAKQKVGYTVEIKFKESCGTKKENYKDPNSKLVANGRWDRAPVQMLTKCAEAAALREAFPEEIGGTPTMEEIEDHMPDIDVIDVTPQAIPTSWARISDGLRENLEKMFTALKMTAAQRLAKVNEFVPNDATADEGAEKLLQWGKDEFAKQQGRPRAATSNKKEPSAKDPAPATAPVSGNPAEQNLSKPNSGDSDSRPAGAEALAGTSHPADSIPEAEAVKAGDIPWGNQGQTKTTAPAVRKAEEYF